MKITSTASAPFRFMALLLAATMFSTSLLACGQSEPPPAVDDSQLGHNRAPAEQEKPGMSTRKKVVLLAGAAALYYLYKKHQNASAQEGPDGQYYLSKNGRVYYRDSEHRAHWVTPPAEGISVPASEAEDYRDFQGYDGQSTGRDLQGLGSDAE
jgi:hypothetical protein